MSSLWSRLTQSLVGAGALALGYGHIEFRDTELLKREAALA